MKMYAQEPGLLTGERLCTAFRALVLTEYELGHVKYLPFTKSLCTLWSLPLQF